MESVASAKKRLTEIDGDVELSDSTEDIRQLLGQMKRSRTAAIPHLTAKLRSTSASIQDVAIAHPPQLIGSTFHILLCHTLA
jgi:hypothetical protein